MPLAVPEPDRHAVCPQRDEAILEFYAGVFEAAFVVLHPFMRPRGVARAEIPGIFARGDAAEICRAFEPVRWSEMQSLCGLASLAHMDVALRSAIGGLRQPFGNDAFASQLYAAANAHRLFPPDEGVLAELLRDPVLSFMQSLGHASAWVGDEFGTERALHRIDDLKPAAGHDILGRSSVFPPDASCLWTVHWDSHFSLVCGSRDAVERLAAQPDIEGFACGPRTSVYWSVFGV